MPEESKTYREYEVLIKDRMWLLLWAPGRRSDYYYAKVKVGTKKYAYRSLKTDNKDLATEKAFDIYAEVINQIKKTGSSSPLTVRSLCNKWIKQKQDRHDGGVVVDQPVLHLGEGVLGFGPESKVQHHRNCNAHRGDQNEQDQDDDLVTAAQPSSADARCGRVAQRIHEASRTTRHRTRHPRRLTHCHRRS